MAELRTLPGLREWVDQTERQLAFHAKSRAEAESWQTQVGVHLRELLGLYFLESAPPTVQLVESRRLAGYRRELITIRVAAGEYMPCYVLRPNKNLAAPPVIALHGHGTWGAKSVVGLAESAEEQEFIDQFHNDYGLQLLREGYTVYAPVLRGLGQRMESPVGVGAWESSCLEVSLNAMLCGTTLIGLRVSDTARLIDVIEKEHVAKPITCVGFSGGGALAMFAAATNKRISRVILSGYLNTFQDSIMAMPHCACNYIPRLLEYVEMSDIAGLIAPRPLLIEHGKYDPIFPLAGLEKAYSALQEIYQQFGAASALDLNIFEGEHRWDGQGVTAWLGRTR